MNKKTFNRILSLLVVVIMCLSMGVNAFAVDVDVNTEEFPVQFSCPGHCTPDVVTAKLNTKGNLHEQFEKLVEEKVASHHYYDGKDEGKNTYMYYGGVYYVLIEPEFKDVSVIFVDENGNEVENGTVTVTVLADATTVNTDMVKDQVPEIYEIVTEGEVEISGDEVVVTLAKKTKEVTIKFFDKNNVQVGNDVVITVPVDVTEIDPATLVIPEEYELNDPELEPVAIEDNTVSIFVTEKAPATKEVTLVYKDMNGEQLKTVKLTVDANDENVSKEVINENLPEGYAVNAYSMYFINDSITVEVYELTKEVTLIYKDTMVGEVVKEVKLTVPERAETLSDDVIEANLPENYEISARSMYFINDSITVEVYAVVEETVPVVPTTPVTPVRPNHHVNMHRFVADILYRIFRTR